MRRTIGVALACLALGVAGTVQAGGNAAAGKAKAASCAGCHGSKGEGVGNNPGLGGQPAYWTYKSLKEYKDGTRPNAMMKTFVMGLSDKDMHDIAAYYESLPYFGK